jgi:hypothetical protein
MTHIVLMDASLNFKVQKETSPMMIKTPITPITRIEYDIIILAKIMTVTPKNTVTIATKNPTPFAIKTTISPTNTTKFS